MSFAIPLMFKDVSASSLDFVARVLLRVLALWKFASRSVRSFFIRLGLFVLGGANDSSSFMEGSAFLSPLHVEDFPFPCSLSTGVALFPVSSIGLSGVSASANVVVMGLQNLKCQMVCRSRPLLHTLV